MITEEQFKILDYVTAGMLARHKSWRAGQGLFNALTLVVPEAAEKIRGSDVDPFYDNKKIKDCIKVLKGIRKL